MVGQASGCAYAHSNLMRIAGFLLLPAGWFLVLSSLVLLHAAWPQAAFVLAGMAVEALGLGMVLRSHAATNRRRG
jgi:hypothetical protein